MVEKNNGGPTLAAAAELLSEGQALSSKYYHNPEDEGKSWLQLPLTLNQSSVYFTITVS